MAPLSLSAVNQDNASSLLKRWEFNGAAASGQNGHTPGWGWTQASTPLGSWEAGNLFKWTAIIFLSMIGGFLFLIIVFYGCGWVDERRLKRRQARMRAAWLEKHPGPNPAAVLRWRLPEEQTPRATPAPPVKTVVAVHSFKDTISCASHVATRDEDSCIDYLMDSRGVSSWDYRLPGRRHEFVDVETDGIKVKDFVNSKESGFEDVVLSVPSGTTSMANVLDIAEISEKSQRLSGSQYSDNPSPQTQGQTNGRGEMVQGGRNGAQEMSQLPNTNPVVGSSKDQVNHGDDSWMSQFIIQNLAMAD